MAKVTKTINQLHFEDLEPRRFEDLVRQLSYDFKNWIDLEDTGKMGSDEGFDIRGKELVINDFDSDEKIENLDKEERIWLFQCKREKAIGPAKLEKYVDDILSRQKGNLYGFIFVASCHFSIKARDKFYQTVKKYNIREAYLWDKSKLEDMLFQPKNDHLLFAYFGMSISMRRRSLKTKIRKKLIPKKKLIKVLGKYSDGYKEVLVRDIEDEKYPYSSEVNNFTKCPKWKKYEFKGYAYNGVILLKSKYYAYLYDDEKHWDYYKQVNLAEPSYNPWKKQHTKKEKDFKNKISELWDKIPDKNKAWLEVLMVLPYYKIIEVDEFGDNIASEYIDNPTPHIYAEFVNNKIPLIDTSPNANLIIVNNLYNVISEPDLNNVKKYFETKLK